MKIGDRVKTRQGTGMIIGKRQKNSLDSSQWWYVNMDAKEDFQNPYHYLERELEYEKV